MYRPGWSHAVLWTLAAMCFGPHEVAAQVPYEFLGVWSTHKEDCEDQQDVGVTVLSVTSDEVAWYEIYCDVLNSRSVHGGVRIEAACEKGGGAKSNGVIEIKRIKPGALGLSYWGLSFAGDSSDIFWFCSAKHQSGTPSEKSFLPQHSANGRTYWSHNGSLMYLDVNGTARKFFYEKPRAGMLKAGVVPGNVLFEGRAEGESYVGTAYIFNRRCGAIPYDVRGPIVDGGRKVIVTGKAPRLDNSCNVVGYLNDRLEFELVSWQ